MAERTVKVRVAVRLHPNGHWYAYSWHDMGKDDFESVLYDMGADETGDGDLFWLTADLPLPTEPEVAASVEGEGRE